VFGREQYHYSIITPPSTPEKSVFRRLRPSKSFFIFRSSSGQSSREPSDDSSSFMSPMLDEDPFSSTEGSDTLFPLNFDEPDEWGERDGTASVGLSFTDDDGIVDSFPESPILLSRRLPPHHCSSGRLPISSSFLSRRPVERPHNPTRLMNDLPTKHVMKQVQDRRPTPFPCPIHHGPVQYSTTPIPFDMFSQPRQARSDSSRRGAKARYTSRSSSFSASFRSPPASFPSPRPAHARSQSSNSSARSFTPQSSLIVSRSMSPPSRRLSTSISLQSLRPSTSGHRQPLHFSSSTTIYPLRHTNVHVPGLEHRPIRTSSGSAYRIDGGHVPFGTLWL
jgi:hypothetical protein